MIFNIYTIFYIMESLKKLHEEYKNKTPVFGFNGLGQFVNERTYSRLKDDGTKEKWNDTIFRVVSNLYSFINKDQQSQIKQTPNQMFRYIFDMEFLCSGRSLDKCGGIAVNSCAFYSFNEHDQSLE